MMKTETRSRETYDVRHESEDDGAHLLAAAAGGDVDAFGELYDLFERPVYSVALRTINDRQKAEEIVQDTFLKIWRQAGSFDPAKGVAAAWIFTIAKRAAIDCVRREQRTPIPSEVTAEGAAVVDPSDEIWASWQVNLALASLPQDQKTVIDLFVLSGFTHVEVAERLNLPLGTVKTRIYAGLKRLRSSMEGDRSEGWAHDM